MCDSPNESVGRSFLDHRESIAAGHSLATYNGLQTTSESLVPYIIPTRPPSHPFPIVHETAVFDGRPPQDPHRLPSIQEALSEVPAYFTPSAAGLGPCVDTSPDGQADGVRTYSPSSSHLRADAFGSPSSIHQYPTDTAQHVHQSVHVHRPAPPAPPPWSRRPPSHLLVTQAPLCQGRNA